MKKYQVFAQHQKWAIVRRVDNSSNKVRELAKLGISRSTYYDWKRNECQTKKKTPHNIWNRVPKCIEDKVKEYRLSGDFDKQSPARIVEQLEKNQGYIITDRLDNAQAHKARKVLRFCQKNNIKMDFITKGCPEENWPVESWHRNLNQDIIYRNGYATIQEWQEAIDQYRRFHNYEKRLRSDPIQRTPAEIAFAYTTSLTQARLKAKLQRKHLGQAKVNKWISPEARKNNLNLLNLLNLSQINHNYVSEMCVS